MADNSKIVPILRCDNLNSLQVQDVVAVEEPLEIRLRYEHLKQTITKSISVTMRTPGHDIELAIGFLFTEGIISGSSEVISAVVAGGKTGNVVIVTISSDLTDKLKKLDRHFYTSSSCGVCGKASIEALDTVCDRQDIKDNVNVHASMLYKLPSILREKQEVFEKTGGLHGCALFDIGGDFIELMEDVGRHNALDKLIGTSVTRGNVPLTNYVLLLSGRASFELVQKSIMAGIKVIASVGAPSSLAVELANEWDITLVCFLRERRFNVYSGAHRIVFS
ncbi:MAG: formate dehydrogenase accessory sulfurtransferase FdhD [Chitinophagaceae bacterium]|nr:formate dehydrogenase accessory sulfurtransferase FdhD [Chitinophagaceae bacterium]